MVLYKQINCFNVNIAFWKILGIYPYKKQTVYYILYSNVFFFTFVFSYTLLMTVNFYFLSRQLDAFIEELLFFFMELTVISKLLTFRFMSNNIRRLLDVLEEPVFQPVTNSGAKVLKNAKKFIDRYWKIVAAVSFTSYFTHILSSFIVHLVSSVPLKLPISSYSFLSIEIKDRFIYLLFLYQSIGMHFHMLSNVNIDTFFHGLMILTICQLDILKEKLSNVTNASKFDHCGLQSEQILVSEMDNRENVIISKFNQAIIHYLEINKFCDLIQDTFSMTLFNQLLMASCILCVCLFRFTLPATGYYYVFLVTYMFIMVIQILVPCWFGTKIIEKSCLLSEAIYNSNWISRSSQFNRNLRIFVERANKPLTITGGKVFLLSLATFTSIMNTAYSFFTLLKNVQSR